MKTVKAILCMMMLCLTMSGFAQKVTAPKVSKEKKGVVSADKPQKTQGAGGLEVVKAEDSGEEDMFAKALKVIELPEPAKEGGMPLMEALQNRKTVREFSDKELDEQMLSNLLWAAFGINREDGKRTAPSAMNRQELELYVVTPSGYYFWHPEKNVLLMLGKDDIRKLTGKQEFVPDAGLNIVMVYNKKKVKEATQRQLNFAFCDAGYISQNIYLFCASEGLNTVARGGGHDEALIKYLQLAEYKEIVLLQTVGFPK